ncbi:MAG TPA: branched-chain amino acid ABC transporter substrate-binding protein [Actinomycetota bacterium]|nr:branched-chain amino acid ABC transporter substrate-binding protein [Actinomycetota bacterium]
MRRGTFLRFLAALSVFAIVAAACREEEAPPTGDGAERIDVSVWFQGALTGDYNYLVIPAFQGAQLRATELNAETDFPVTITVKQGDTQGDPANAPPVVEQVVSDPDTVAVVGPAFSGESEASGDTYNDAGIPFVTPSATNPALADKEWDYWYRGVANDAGQGALAGQYLDEIVGAQSVFVSHDKGTYGQGLAEVVQETLEGAGVEVAGFEGIETGATDFSAFITGVEKSGADTLFFGGYDADFGKIVKQIRDEGLDIELMSADGSTSITFLALAGEEAEGTHLVCPCNLAGDFADRYNAAYGGKIAAVPIYAAEGYDAMSMIGEGIRQAVDGGATTAEDIRLGIKEYLDTLTPDNPFDGEAKQVAFDPETHELAAEDPESLYYFYKVEGGSIVGLGSAPEVLGG